MQEFGAVRATPIFTTEQAAVRFAEMLTEDAEGEDAKRFRAMTLECVRQVNPREIPRASLVAVDPRALRNPDDDVATVIVDWGGYYDWLAAELN